MEKNNIKFIATGDWGMSSYINNLNTLNLKKIKDLQFNILLGDNFYPNGVISINDNQWKNKFGLMFNQEIPSFAILGNHDYIQNPEAQILYTKYSNSWKMPFYYYDIVVNIYKKSVHFIFIDTNLLAEDITLYLLKNTNTNNESIQNYYKLINKYKQHQKKWLEKTLKKSKTKWKIVCGHYPVHSNGPHKISTELQNFLIPLLEKYKVDFYISGHDHNLQHLIKNNINYVVSGAFSSYYPKNFSTTMAKTLFFSTLGGVVKFEINDNSISLDFLASNNSIIYNYLLSKL